MTDPKKAGTNDEVHGYDVLDRLESESLDRTSRPSPPAWTDSAYDQLWSGEDGSYLGD
jgi:hypothetical protein